MKNAVRRYLAEIGRKGGMRSRRQLAPEVARAMVRAREARRAARAFAASALATSTPALPGVELVQSGLDDLANKSVSDASLLVAIAAPRLARLGVRVVSDVRDPERALQERLLAEHGDAAHGRYNALRRRITSFANAAAQCAR
jgi:hypothetical protein